MFMDEKLVPQRRFAGFTADWEQSNWRNTVDISTNMVNPQTGEFDDLAHIGPGNIESFSGRLLDNVKTVKEDNLISGKFHFNKGDVIYGKINPQLGKYVYAQIEGLASADAYVLNAKNGLAQRFLFALIQTKDFFNYSVSVSMRSGMPKINREELNLYNFYAPTYEEQKKIGEFFANLDNLIASQQHKLNKTKALKSAYLSEMFPAVGECKPKRRFAGFTDDWEMSTLGDFSKITMGQSPNSINYTDNPNDYILVQGNADMKNGKVYPRVWTTQITKKADPGDLILSVRAPVGDVGKTDFSIVIGRGVASIKGNEFLFQTLGKMKLNGYWVKMSTGSTFDSINSDDIKNAAIMIPTMKEQKKIGEFFANFDNLIASQQQKLDKLENMKKAYLNEMFI
jgi:type I restriction enzyme S subunit